MVRVESENNQLQLQIQSMTNQHNKELKKTIDELDRFREIERERQHEINRLTSQFEELKEKGWHDRDKIIKLTNDLRVMEEILKNSRENATEAARKDVSRQLHEYREKDKQNHERLQSRLSQLNKDNSLLKKELNKREQTLMRTSRRKTDETISTLCKIQCKWPKTKGWSNRKYVTAQLIAKHKELVIQSTTQVDRFKWNHIKQIKAGNDDLQIMIILVNKK
eukprot:UN25083